MNNKKLISFIVLIIAGIVIFSAGVILGFLNKTPTELSLKQSQTLESLSSGAISSIVASGQVAKIEGRNITLENSGDNIMVLMQDSASVYFSTPQPEIAGMVVPATKQVVLEDIQVGDTANIVLKLMPGGEIQGTSIVIFKE